MKIASNARLAGCLMLLATLTTAAPAHAGLITGTISGQVTFVDSSVSTVAVGELVVGSYSYDTSIVIPDGFGEHFNPFTSFNVSIGTQPSVFSLADLSQDYGRWVRFSTDVIDRLYVIPSYGMISKLIGRSLFSWGVATGFPNPQSQTLTIYDASSSFATDLLTLSFTATPTGTAAVPEPTGFAMLAIGAAALASVAARGRSRR